MLLLIFASGAAAPDPDPAPAEEDENLGSGGQKRKKSGQWPNGQQDTAAKFNRARLQFRGPESLSLAAQAVIALIASGALEEY